MVKQLERLHDVISEVLELDPTSLSAADRHELTIGLQRAEHRLGAARAAAVEAWAASGIWASNGARSPSVRLAREANCSVGTARAEVARARQLAKMPAARAALAEGAISLDHVRLLGLANQPTRADAFTGDEEMLVGLCRRLTFADAQRAIDYWCQRVDADTVEADAAELADRNELRVSESFQGVHFLDGKFDPVAGAIITNELDRLERLIRHDDKKAGITRTRSQRMATAMIRMAERSAAKPKGAKKARVLFRVVVGDDSLARLCELGNGKAIAPGQLLPYLDRADIESILFDGPSTVVSVSHKRCFTGAVREAVIARDRRCQHPSGCDEPADRCDVDHKVPHSQGGPTSQFNGEIGCPPHNRIPQLHHDDTEPLPYREVTRLDEFRGRLRWRILHGEFDDDYETPAQARARWAAEPVEHPDDDDPGPGSDPGGPDPPPGTGPPQRDQPGDDLRPAG